jgi:cobalamin synthase
MYYPMALASVFGAIALKRRKITLVPFVGLLVEIALSAVLTIGATRYRVPLEVGLVVLTAVAVDRALAGLVAFKHRDGVHEVSSRPAQS